MKLHLDYNKDLNGYEITLEGNGKCACFYVDNKIQLHTVLQELVVWMNKCFEQIDDQASQR